MALCSLTTRRLDVPGEDGQWVEIRPLSARVVRKINEDARLAAGDDPVAFGYEVADRVLAAGVVAWSYDAPVNAETLVDVDVKTTMWLADEIVPEMGAVPLATSSPSTIALTE